VSLETRIQLAGWGLERAICGVSLRLGWRRCGQGDADLRRRLVRGEVDDACDALSDGDLLLVLAFHVDLGGKDAGVLRPAYAIVAAGLHAPGLRGAARDEAPLHARALRAGVRVAGEHGAIAPRLGEIALPFSGLGAVGGTRARVSDILLTPHDRYCGQQ